MGILSGGKPQPEKKPEPEDLPDELYGEFEKVVGWRTESLVEHGYPVRYAERIAWHLGVDLREAERLLDEGCPPKVAVEILL